MDWHSASSLQLIIFDLNEIAADAYRHRIRPRAKKGGNGVYDTTNGGFVYVLPTRYESNHRARFAVTLIEANTLVLKAVSLEDPSCSLRAAVDSRGRLTQLEFSDEPTTDAEKPRERLSPDRGAMPITDKRFRPRKIFEDV